MIYFFIYIGDDLQDFVDCFDDGKVQYGFARVTDPNSNLPKFVLVGWVGEGIPERVKGYFNAHFSAISKYFPVYHVQITARSQDDLSVAQILTKVASASGANYSAGINKKGAVPLRPQYRVSATGASEDDWGDAPPVVEGKVTKVQSSYKPTKVDIAAIRAQAKPSTVSSTPKTTTVERPDVVKGSYQPIGKVDIAAIRAQARDNKFNPKPEPLQSSYKPIGKVDISALRNQANKRSETESAPKPAPKATPKAPEPKPKKEEKKEEEEEEEELKPVSVHDRMKAFGGQSSSPANNDDDEEEYRPLSLKERMKAYEQNKSDNTSSFSKPKPVAKSKFTPAKAAGTVPPLPQNEFGSSSSRIVGGASRDFGSENNKTPAQIWAEKHGKAKPSSSNSSAPSAASEIDTEEEHEKVENIRAKFASASVEDTPAKKDHDDDDDDLYTKKEAKKPEPEEEEEEDKESVGDLKAKFAQRFAAKPAAPPPSLPQRNDSPPPPPPAARSVPPPPPSRPQEEEKEEEDDDDDEDVVPLKPSNLPERNLPPPPPAREESPDLPKRSLPPIIHAPEPALPKRNLPPSFVPPPAAPVAPAAPAEPEPAPVAAPVPASAPEPEEEQEEEESGAHGEHQAPIDALVLYDYDKDEDNEISLAENEIVTIIDFPDEKWWTAKNKKGEEGLIPSDFVQVLKPPYAIAEYDYEADEETEISFPEGGIITEIQFTDDEWWTGNYYNSVGLFPANYVELKDKLP